MQGSILIADDEPLARRTLRQYLLDLGWAGPILEAADGEAAIAIGNGRRPGGHGRNRGIMPASF